MKLDNNTSKHVLANEHLINIVFLFLYCYGYFMQNQKGFSIVVGVLVILVICIIGFAGWRVLDKNKDNNLNQTTNSIAKVEQSKSSEPIALMLQGSNYNVAAMQGKCDALDKNCSASYIVRLSDYAKDFPIVYNNLVRENWNTMEGRPFTLNLTELQNSQESYKYSIFNFIALRLFGDDSYIEKNGTKARFFAFSEQEKQTNENPYYVYESEVSGIFDWKSLLSQLKEGEYYLNISLQPK